MTRAAATTSRGFFELIAQRRSVRKFDPRELESEHLEAIVDAARRAPSAGNLQAYEIVVVRSLARRQQLAEAAFGEPCLSEAPAALVFLVDEERSATRYGRRGARLFAYQDATLAAAYAQLAAHALGLGSVWVGAFDDARVAAVIDTPSHLLPVALLVVGRPAETPEETPRRPTREHVHKEAFDAHQQR